MTESSEDGLRLAVVRLLKHIGSVRPSDQKLSSAELGRRVYEAVVENERKLRTEVERQFLSALLHGLSRWHPGYPIDHLRLIEHVTSIYLGARDSSDEHLIRDSVMAAEPGGGS